MNTRKQTRPYVLSLIAVVVVLVFLPLDDTLAADPEVVARASAEGYLDYTIERNQKDVGYFERLFGVPLPDSGRGDATLGKPFVVLSLDRSGVEKFADSDKDILEHAVRTGFAFPLVVDGEIPALIETARRDRKWVWSQVRARRDPVLTAFKQFGARTASKSSKEEFMLVQTFSVGSYLIVRDRDKIKKIAPIGKHSVDRLGLGKGGEGVFVDYSTVEGRLRSAAGGKAAH